MESASRKHAHFASRTWHPHVGGGARRGRGSIPAATLSLVRSGAQSRMFNASHCPATSAGYGSSARKLNQPHSPFRAAVQPSLGMSPLCNCGCTEPRRCRSEGDQARYGMYRLLVTPCLSSSHPRSCDHYSMATHSQAHCPRTACVVTFRIDEFTMRALHKRRALQN